MPVTEFSERLHAVKYRSPGESFREYGNRVAAKLADNPVHYRIVREILIDQRFLPAGRIQSAVGSLKQVTPYNCFVSGTIADSYVDDEGSIMQRATEAARTLRLGGGIGYDFSTLRPRGDLIAKLQSQATGPVSFMDIFNSVCKNIASAGHRRGAQMAVLRVDHPDVEEYVHAKQNIDQLTYFNTSIAVTDEFMEAKETGRPFMLRFGGRPYREVDPVALWEMIMRSTWDWAEPGVLFVDAWNRENNLWYCERIAATNPCGEQPLPPHGACLLGSFNLPSYLTQQTSLRDADTPRYSFDWDQFIRDVAPVVRAMDNVVDLARYPLPEQEHEARSKRRMGLGVTGLANAGEALGLPYGSRGFLAFEAQVLDTLATISYLTSVELAREKGAFPVFDADRYCEGAFIRRLDPEVQQAIREHGVRNSHLTSVAPTGTISMCADNVSSSVEPVLAFNQERAVKLPDGEQLFQIPDFGAEFLSVRGRRAAEVTAEEHVAVLTTAARRVDSSVSKTVNMSGDMPWDDFKNLYQSAWEGGAKGCTTFNSDGRRMALLRSADDEDTPKVHTTVEQSCTVDLETGRRECA